MKRALYIIIPLVLLAVVAVRLKSNKETAQASVYHYNREKAIPIQAQTLKAGQIATDYSYTGTFEPVKESNISAEIQGKITAVYVDAGSYVKQGQALMQLDKALLELQLEAVEVQMEGLEADVKRYTILNEAEAIQGVQLEKASLGLKSARVQKNTLLEQIRKSTIRAPFNGIITARMAEEGSFAAPGMPLLQLTDISQLEFTVNVPENDLALFGPEKTYVVSPDAYPAISRPARLSMTGSKANKGRLFPVQLSLSNTPDLKIKSGMFGKVKLSEGKVEKGILIPASAIVGSAMEPQVYVIKDGRARLQHIRISRRINDKAVVESGLKEGDLLATSGFINLFDGAHVELTKSGK